METQQLVIRKQTGLDKLKHNYQVNKPRYLQGATYAGIGLTAVSGVITGLLLPKAIDKAKAEITKEDSTPKKVFKYAKHIAPVVMPTVLSATGTVIASHGVYKELGHRLSIASTAYAGAIAENKLLKAKLEEVGGKKVAEKVKKAVNDEKVKDKEFPEDKQKLEEQRNTSPNSAAYTGGQLPYYDPMLQKIFWTTPDVMMKIQTKMLAQIDADNEVDMTILYEELGFGGYGSRNKMPMFAYDYGWKVNNAIDIERLRNHLPDAFFETSTAITKDNIPCNLIEYIDMHPLRIDMPF